MPVDPRKKWDVFVSYAHIDNRRVGAIEAWVTGFIDSLCNLLAQATGHKEIAIWHDAEMKAAESFNDSIAEAISNSAVFLILLSPSWKSSEYCAQELDWFNRSAGPAGSMVGNSNRIVAVQRGKVPFEEWPSEIRGQHEVVCFFDPALPVIPLALTEAAFLTSLGALVDGIAAVLLAMKAQRLANTSADEVRNAAPPVAPNRVPALYLAVSTCLAREREELLRDLEQLCQQTGAAIRIEPAAALPSGKEAAAKAISAALDRSTASLHLIGAEPDEKPAGWDRSQGLLELEAALTQPLSFRPLVWLPKSVDIAQVDSKTHTRLLESLRDTARPPSLPPGITAEIYSSDFEQLKTEIHLRMAPKSNPVRTSPRGRSKRRKLIYISHNGSGALTAIPKIEDCFDHNAYEVVALDNQIPNGPNMHRAMLPNCVGFLCLYDSSTIDWADAIALDALMYSRNEEQPTALGAVELIPACPRPLAVRADSIILIRLSAEGEPRAGMGRFLATLGAADG